MLDSFLLPASCAAASLIESTIQLTIINYCFTDSPCCCCCLTPSSSFVEVARVVNQVVTALITSAHVKTELRLFRHWENFSWDLIKGNAEKLSNKEWFKINLMRRRNRALFFGSVTQLDAGSLQLVESRRQIASAKYRSQLSFPWRMASLSSNHAISDCPSKPYLIHEKLMFTTRKRAKANDIISCRCLVRLLLLPEGETIKV